MAKTTPRARAFTSIVAAIRDDVFQRRLAPGDRLPTEEALADRFRVSRSVVREALRVLELQGLVAVRHGYGGGAFVAELNTSPVSTALETLLRLERVEPQELHEARLLMEPAIARSAAGKAQPQDLDRMADNLRRCELGLEGLAGAFADNLGFHRLIAAASGNPVFGLVMQALIDALTRLEVRHAPDARAAGRILGEHRAIFEAVRTGSADLAAGLMADHLQHLSARPQPSGASPDAPTSIRPVPLASAGSPAFGRSHRSRRAAARRA